MPLWTALLFCAAMSVWLSYHRAYSKRLGQMLFSRLEAEDRRTLVRLVRHPIPVAAGDLELGLSLAWLKKNQFVDEVAGHYVLRSGFHIMVPKEEEG